MSKCSPARPRPNLTPDNTDTGIDVDCVTGSSRRQRVDVAVSHSLGFGGHNAVLAFRRP
jgi:3-oxoacyl-(acyl-carrier-protein) synthase